MTVPELVLGAALQASGGPQQSTVAGDLGHVGGPPGELGRNSRGRDPERDSTLGTKVGKPKGWGGWLVGEAEREGHT